MLSDGRGDQENHNGILQRKTKRKPKIASQTDTYSGFLLIELLLLVPLDSRRYGDKKD